MKLYFAYGANLNIESMRWRCPDAVAVRSFYLQGWRLAFSGVATIQPDVSGTVAGALWAISDQDEQALDVFEGWPTLYCKQIISSEGLEFMVYRMNNDPAGLPSVPYIETIAQGYRDWDLDPDCLVSAVKRTQQEINDDMHRSPITGIGRLVTDLAIDTDLELGHDLCHSSDLWNTHTLYPALGRLDQ
jgi:gamma-glutamylcyclotransferase